METSTRSAEHYRWFLDTPARKHWEKVGLHPRSGVVVPMFSMFTRNSQGIGDFADLRRVVDWCPRAGLSILQLLPLNDVGFDFTPYNAQSMFALEPMYLSLADLQGVAADADTLRRLRDEFPIGRRVNYRIKGAKLARLWELFRSREWRDVPAWHAFRETNRFWLDEYALFKVLKEEHGQRSWWEWPEAHRDKDARAMEDLRRCETARIDFQTWLQWQAWEQLTAVKRHAGIRGVLLLGDLPFLVARDSADVWARQEYFKLDLASGAPPDMYVSEGQRWGMPPYRWETIAAHGYDYLIAKLKTAAQYYDLYRIDHFVGVFRIWTIPESEPAESAGRRGTFDPPAEHDWESHGQRLLDVMLAHTDMLPCAEDLGTVPDCSFTTIREYGIVGTNIQRWMREWKTTKAFTSPDAYRENSLASLSTHDIPVLAEWWEGEAGTVDEGVFRRTLRERGLDEERIVAELFDAGRSRPGRLRWKANLTEEQMLWSLQRPRDQVADLVDTFRITSTERAGFWSMIQGRGEPPEACTPELARLALETANRSASIFSVQLLQDWLAPTDLLGADRPEDQRINVPGTTQDRNWSWVVPFHWETLESHPVTGELLELNRRTGRIPEIRP